MKLIRIGLATSDLSSLLHKCIYIESKDGFSVAAFSTRKAKILNEQFVDIGKESEIEQTNFPSDCQIEIKGTELWINSIDSQNRPVCLTVLSPSDVSKDQVAVVIVKPRSGKFTLKLQQRDSLAKTYTGQLAIVTEQNKMRLILQYPLEEYVQSVLQGEIPASYHIEAIKAQAVCARTYGLYPRVNHSNDLCDVCDSYQCCQCFSGIPEKRNPLYVTASTDTEGEILFCEDKPALALFSSSGGGHTENYEDCFSDSKSKAFPPQPIPYLRGVSENLDPEYANQTINETYLRKLWQMHEPQTVDAWAKNFRWSVKLSAENLESHIHNNAHLLLAQKDVAPFIVLPPSGIFGEICSFQITKRGIGGTAITLKIETSKGIWKFEKELIIRNLFKNPKLNLKRLSSARVYFDHIRDGKGSLSSLHIYGLGSGHGVGLQQTGAEGLARTGKNYKQILAHYYTKILIAKI